MTPAVRMQVAQLEIHDETLARWADAWREVFENVERLRRAGGVTWPQRWVAGIDASEMHPAVERLWTVPYAATFGDLEPEYVGRHRAPEPDGYDDYDDIDYANDGVFWH